MALAAARERGMKRTAKTLALALLALYVAVGLVASHRAFYPVSRVTILLPSTHLEPGRPIRIETVSSGRGPVSIRVEAVQAGRSHLLAMDHVGSKPWAYWDPRRVVHRTDVLWPLEVLVRLQPGSVTLRATASGVPAWLRRPPLVVDEVTLSFPGVAPPGD